MQGRGRRRPARGEGCGAARSTDSAPTQNIATRSSVTMRRSSSSRAASPSTAARRNGAARAAASAPRAMQVAASRPLRRPPDAITRPSGKPRRQATTLSAVGMPHSWKVAATRRITGSAIRCRSTWLHEVPPAPAASTPATPASARARATFSAMPQPTSFTSTGTPMLATTSAIRLTTPAKRGVPSGCSASCRGFVWSTRASASIISTARRQRSRAPGSRSWETPRLATSGTLGASSRTWNDSASAASSRAARCEPTPTATPHASAARARRRLICAPRSTPPVMHEITSGARTGRPSRVARASTSSRSSSGSAWWTRR